MSRAVGTFTPRHVLEDVCTLQASGRRMTERPLDHVTVAAFVAEPADEVRAMSERIIVLVAMQHVQALAFPVCVVPIAVQPALLYLLESVVASGMPIQGPLVPEVAEAARRCLGRMARA